MSKTVLSRRSGIWFLSLSAFFGFVRFNAEAASITIEKDSALFPYLYDGADLVNSLGWSVTSGTPAGSIVNTTQMAYAGGTDTGVDKGFYGWGNAVSHAAGYTVEFRYQITDDSPVFGVFGLLIGNASSVADYMILDLDAEAVRLDQVDIATGDFTDAFHTLRLAQPANGGDGDTHMWVDGVLVANNLTGQVVDGLSRFWLGNRTNVAGGSAIIDWIRIDNTGAFAPVPIPEPTGFVLAGVGLASFTYWHRRRGVL